jgi:hypothetical protein
MSEEQLPEKTVENNSEITTTNVISKDIKKIVKNLDSPILKYVENITEEFKPKSNCKLCMSPFRTEAEIEYERTKSIKLMHAFLKNKDKNYDGSYISAERHINKHYKRFEQNMKIKEWSESLPELIEAQKGREKSLKDRIAILNQELMIVATCSDEEGSDHKLKSVEMVRKLSDSLTLLEDKLAEEQKRTEPILIIIDRLKDIISSRIKSTDNNAVKQELMKVLELWMESVKDLEM